MDLYSVSADTLTGRFCTGEGLISAFLLCEVYSVRAHFLYNMQSGMRVDGCWWILFFFFFAVICPSVVVLCHSAWLLWKADKKVGPQKTRFSTALQVLSQLKVIKMLNIAWPSWLPFPFHCIQSEVNFRDAGLHIKSMQRYEGRQKPPDLLWAAQLEAKTCQYLKLQV